MGFWTAYVTEITVSFLYSILLRLIAVTIQFAQRVSLGQVTSRGLLSAQLSPTNRFAACNNRATL
jgi:hypothetical protein